MKQIGITRIDEKAEEVSDILQVLGIDRKGSLTLACMMNGTKVVARDVEKLTGLRQPEVSIAMKELGEMGWVEVISNTPKAGKGRPEHNYQLKVDFKDIIKQLESKHSISAALIGDKLKSLRALTPAAKKTR